MNELTTEAIDKLFLELSQVTKAKTAREIELEAIIGELLSVLSNSYNGDYQDIYLKEISEIHVMSEIKSYIQVTRFQGSSQIIS